MRAIIKAKFPCGYEWSAEVEGWGTFAKIDDHELPVCPIHKDQCKRR